MIRLTVLRHRTARGRHRVNRDGYLYVGVMLVAMIVGLIGLTSAHVGRLHLRSAIDASSAGQAAALASSAIEYALATIQNDDSWRTTYQDDTEYPATPMSMNGGTWTWKLVDVDGDLNDDDSDFVRIVGIGRDAGSTIVLSLTAYPTGAPLPVMDYALHSDGTITFDPGLTVTTDRSISSNGWINGPPSSSIVGNAVATLGLPLPVTGNATFGVAARRMPGSSVFDYYQTRGTSIAVTALPLSGGARVLEQTVLSPASNVYGSRNAGGIYIIDCQALTVHIRDCRIAGTLLLLNAGAGSSVSDSVVWEPILPGFPALLVSGSLTLNLSNAVLNETTLNTNFNPTGTPYLGESDNDTVDIYPTGISGGVYVSGNLTVAPTAVSTMTTGTVIVGGVTAMQSSAVFSYDATSSTYPPPGFASGNPMKPMPGSLQRVPVSP